MRFILSFYCLFLVGLNTGFSQEKNQDKRVIQLSGVVTFEEAGQIIPLPFASIGVLGTSRGTYTEFDGFFSIAVEVGDTVEIRSLGFKSERIVIPEDAETYYSILRTLEQESLDLPMVDILPIPSREHFKEEFLAMNISNPLIERARENLAAGILNDLRESLPVDGAEAAGIYQSQVIQEYVYTGQIKPQNIFNVVAWKNFIDAWKRGDFKKKKDKK